jgi:hypothetical protein
MVSVAPWTAPAVLIPAPPKTASQTLTALVGALMPPDLDRPAMDGGVHQSLKIDAVRRLERWRFHSGLKRPPKAALVYGHYLPTRLNLKRIARRYQPAVCCIPIRPLGQLVCSLIAHCDRGSGPIDPKLINRIEGLSHFQDLNPSERFELLAVRYLPLIQNLIDGWIDRCAALNIPCLVIPFTSITNRQTELQNALISLLPVSPKQQPKATTASIRRNPTTTTRTNLNNIDPAVRQRIRRLAELLFQDDRPSIQVLHHYLKQDLSDNSTPMDLPLLWTPHQGRVGAS